MVKSHFSKRLVSYTEPHSSDDPIKLVFADGTSAFADVVIGCDGLHSVTRHEMLETAATEVEASGKDGCRAQAEELRNSITALWSGRATYRATVSSEEVEALFPNHRACRKPMMVSKLSLPCFTLINVCPEVYRKTQGSIFELDMQKSLVL